MDRFAVLGPLGAGAFGAVVRARDRATGDVVAIKRVWRRYASWDECVALGEVRVLARLAHPNVVRLREVFREGGALHFVFEYAAAGSLGGLIRARHEANAALPLGDIARLARDVLRGLAYLHANGFLHRDLKPDNVLLCTRPGGCRLVAKVADLGAAREADGRALTEYVGTRWYRAPEMLWPRAASAALPAGLPCPVGEGRPYGPPADVWACGCVLAELVLLRPLFPGRDELDTLARVAERLAAGPETLLLGAPGPVPPSLVSLLEGLLRWRPADRLTAAQALAHPFFAEALGQGREGRSVLTVSEAGEGEGGCEGAGVPDRVESVPPAARPQRAERPRAPVPPRPASEATGLDAGLVGEGAAW